MSWIIFLERQTDKDIVALIRETDRGRNRHRSLNRQTDRTNKK